MQGVYNSLASTLSLCTTLSFHLKPSSFLQNPSPGTTSNCFSSKRCHKHISHTRWDMKNMKKNDPNNPQYLQQGLCFTLSALGPLQGPHCLGAEAGIPPPVSGLHGGTMGKDKPWETRPPRGWDYCRAMLTPPPTPTPPSLVVYVHVWTLTSLILKMKRKHSKPMGNGKWKALMKLPDWGGEIVSKRDYTEKERARTLSLTLLNLHNTEQDIAAPSTLFTVWSQDHCVNKCASSSCLQAKAALWQRMHWQELECSSVIVFKCPVLAFASHVPTSLETNTAVFSPEGWIIQFRWLEVRCKK